MEPHGNARKTCLSSRMEWLILPLLLFQVGLAQAATIASSYTTLQVRSGALYGWGKNDCGQIGNGAQGEVDAPQLADYFKGITVTAVTIGQKHSLALDSNGKVYAWGSNSSGELGNGTTSPYCTLVPAIVTLPGGIAAKAIFAGAMWNQSLTTIYEQSFALGSDGNLYAWGYNTFNALGLIPTSQGQPVCNPCVSPQKTTLPAGVTAVSAAPAPAFLGGDIGTPTSSNLYLGSDGKVYQTGIYVANGAYVGYTNIPLPGGASATAIASGYGIAFAVASTGQLYGFNTGFTSGTSGIVLCEMGQGSSTSVPGATVPSQSTATPIGLPGGVNTKTIAAGYSHVIAGDANGHLYAWGSNSAGQLGTGANSTDCQPTAVQLPGGITATAYSLELASMTTSTGGTPGVSFALGSDSKLYAWGDDTVGELGDGCYVGLYLRRNEPSCPAFRRGIS